MAVHDMPLGSSVCVAAKQRGLSQVLAQAFYISKAAIRVETGGGPAAGGPTGAVQS